MKFTLEASPRVHLIRAYSTEEIRIGEQVIRGTCLVTADTVITDWEPATIAELEERHLEKVFALQPEIVLLGTGATQHFAPRAIRAAFAARHVGLEAMDLGAACRTFNVLVQEERRVAAALFLK